MACQAVYIIYAPVLVLGLAIFLANVVSASSHCNFKSGLKFFFINYSYIASFMTVSLLSTLTIVIR